MKMFFVKDWNKFQHYKDRNPPWIKLQTDCFRNYEFSQMSDASKLLAICIWTLASRTKDGSFPADLEYIKNFGMLTIIKKENLKELLDQGFIIDASNMLADCKQSAIPETYREEAEDIEKSREEKNLVDFEEWYSDYPHKIGKAAAKKAFSSAIKKTSYGNLVHGLERYVLSKPPDRPWCNPATWLNQERWQDQPLEALPKKSHSRKAMEVSAEVAAQMTKEGY